ncbi:hypothetical protein [Streptomyces zaehneri]|uniref:hypothetical protein n=1 Tax=Streptomyces zaehneri TaxID=3051180 RepID=UPI0028D2EBF0|nr:hypothetical protein [Streptomyces sp. DSM 40713]
MLWPAPRAVRAGDQVDEDIQHSAPGRRPGRDLCVRRSLALGVRYAVRPTVGLVAACVIPIVLRLGGRAADVDAGGSAPSPEGGGTVLAETCASGRAPVVGVGAVLVLAGGGIVLGLRRRTAQRSR